jgi:hypothetical protein
MQTQFGNAQPLFLCVNRTVAAHTQQNKVPSTCLVARVKGVNWLGVVYVDQAVRNLPVFGSEVKVTARTGQFSMLFRACQIFCVKEVIR